MAKKNNQPSEEEVFSSASTDLNESLKNDPAMQGLKDDKNYGHYKAHVKVPINGEIPDIPEVETASIDVDLTNAGNEGAADDDAIGGGSHERDFQPDPDDIKSPKQEDIPDDTKIQFAEVANQLLFQGIDMLNDLLIRKIVINESKLKELAVAGEIPFEIIQVRVQFAPTYIFDMTEFLEQQEEKTRKALAFTNAEKKHIGDLLQKIVITKKVKMTPEGALFAALLGHYAAAGYQLFMNNMEVQNMVALIAQRWAEDHQNQSQETSRRQAKATTKTMAKPPEETKQPETKPEPAEEINNSSEGPIGEIREPGEISDAKMNDPVKPRRVKRSVSLADVQEAQLI
jgi:hypothetical protein